MSTVPSIAPMTPDRTYSRLLGKLIRTYMHQPSDGSDPVEVLVHEKGRRYFIGNHAFVVPELPTTAAGRYAYDHLRELEKASPRRAYRKLHDDYMLETPEIHRIRDWSPSTPGARRRARIQASLQSIVAVRKIPAWLIVNPNNPAIITSED